MRRGTGRRNDPPGSPLWRVGSLLKEASRFLAQKGVEEARLESELLMAHTLSLDRVGLYASYSKPVEPGEVDSFRDLVKRRIAGEPTAYLIGCKEFFSIEFLVSPAVLIPRPETEELVQSILDLVPDDGAGCRIGDLGTGSGCVAVTVAKLKKQIEITATEISREALDVAVQNAERHGVLDRIAFLEGDLVEPLVEEGLSGRFHVLACNPPYIDPQGPLQADPHVALFEPSQALFTPAGDPCCHYRSVLSHAGQLLAPGGVVLFEVGYGMADSVEELGGQYGLEPFVKRRDLAGNWRVVGFRSAGGAAGL